MEVFHQYEDPGQLTHTRNDTRPERDQVARPKWGTAPPGPVWPSSIASALPFYVVLRLAKKPYAIFF